MEFPRTLAPFAILEGDMFPRSSNVESLLSSLLWDDSMMRDQEMRGRLSLLENLLDHQGYRKKMGQVGDQVVKMNDNKDNLEFYINAKDFKPDEVKVSIDKDKRSMKVEADHEEKSEDGTKYVKRHFIRQFVLPENCTLEKVTSKLSPTGLLIINAPKEQPEDQKRVKNHTNIPIKIE